MKIGYFNTIFPYKNPLTKEILLEQKSGRGVEDVVFNLTVKMMERGHNIDFFSSSINKKESIEKYGKITIYRYKKNFNIGRSPVSLKLLYKPLQLKNNLDIIHAHLGNLPAPIAAYWYAKKRKKPFIITYHGDTLGGFGDPIRRIAVLFYKIFLVDMLLSNADIIIALSEYNVNESKFLRKYREKIRIIPNGINLKDYHISLSKKQCREKLFLPSDKKILLFLSSLIQIKAPNVLLDAMKKILIEFPDSHLVFVSDGPMRQQLERQAKELGIKENVTFAGFVPEELKKVYYTAADIFILPSFSEAFPVVLLEASACGLPFIVSSLESFRPIVKEGYNGLYTITGDHIDLANKIIYLLQNDELIKQFGNNSKELVKKFSWDEIITQIENVYSELIRL